MPILPLHHKYLKFCIGKTSGKAIFTVYASQINETLKNLNVFHCQLPRSLRSLLTGLKAIVAGNRYSLNHLIERTTFCLLVLQKDILRGKKKSFSASSRDPVCLEGGALIPGQVKLYAFIVDGRFSIKPKY